MHAARALTATLARGNRQLRYPAMPVVVKTPALPTVVCPPAAGVDGTWQSEREPGGVVSRFTDANNRLRGFAPVGSASAQKQGMLGEMQLG